MEPLFLSADVTSAAALATAVAAAVATAVATGVTAAVGLTVARRQVRQARADAATAVAEAARCTAEAQRSATAAERSLAEAERSAAAVRQAGEIIDGLHNAELRRQEHLANTPRVVFGLEPRAEGWYLSARSDGPLAYTKVEIRLVEALGSPYPLEKPGFLHPYGDLMVVESTWNVAVLRPGDRPSVRVPDPQPAGGLLLVQYSCSTTDDHWEGSYPLHVAPAQVPARRR